MAGMLVPLVIAANGRDCNFTVFQFRFVTSSDYLNLTRIEALWFFRFSRVFVNMRMMWNNGACLKASKSVDSSISTFKMKSLSNL